MTNCHKSDFSQQDCTTSHTSSNTINLLKEKSVIGLFKNQIKILRFLRFTQFHKVIEGVKENNKKIKELMIFIVVSRIYKFS